jgi:hypothetical protein
MLTGKLPRFKNGQVELVEKKEIIKNPNMNLVEFEPE